MPKCNEEGCDVLKTGECLNRFEDIKSCPQYALEDGKDSNPSDISSDLNSVEENEQKRNEADVQVSVHSGLSLLEEEVNSISKETYTRLIILAGMPKAGKTTALLTLMHQFQTHSNYREYLFAGSKTLIDFEQKGWPSRTHSKNETADTVRTNDMEPKFVHLKLARKNSLEIKENMLFTDVSGELFRTLKDSTPESKKFILASRADHFALFFDAHALSEMSQRYAARVSGLGILKSLVEAGVLTKYTRVQIVFSRWDLFATKNDKEIHLSFIEEIQKEIEGKYASTYQLTFHRIASRPSKSELPFAYGVGELFDIWIKDSQLDFNAETLTVTSQEIEGARQFSKYSFIKEII